MSDLEDLRDLVAELTELDADQLDVDTPFADVGIDSLMAMEIAVHVEHRYGVRFNEGDLATVTSVRDLSTLVEAQRG
ncbi:MAG: acyl carrier protein [Actinobacteria bacterium]|jgi:acyl carrier protein|nr:acyl carrier protein [Actinomycetota bacterium]